jgi:hypothetical protein
MPPRALRVLARLALVAFAVGSIVVGCKPDDDLTPQQKTCAAKLYSQYRASDLEQCVNVCKACRNGNTNTCTTSCKLKGAS